MTANIQYVGFQVEGDRPRIQFPFAGIIDRATRDHIYDFERGIPLPWFTLSRCAGPLLTEAASRDWLTPWTVH